MADEIQHVKAGGRVIKRNRVRQLLNLAGIHHRDPVGHYQGFFLIMGHENCGNADLSQQLLQFNLHGFTQFAIQRGKRFVQQQ